ncbi:PAS domain-containing sensor histidine kinase [uncultured Sphingomonas sp.]|uniref:sensor histidine kinase n=1 Tax=uncultured Sphingomonas sp. TaxID=158754 RepID=UPI0035CAF3BE
MGFDARFTLVLAAWVAALLVALGGILAAFAIPDLVAARIVAILLLAGALAGLWSHVQRTNIVLARFVEALHHGDLAARFDRRGGAGFADLATALDDAMRRLQADTARFAQDQRYLEALIDDMPVALLTVGADGGVSLRNRAARQLFTAQAGVRPADFAVYGATFAARLAGEPGPARELVLIDLPDGPQRAALQSATVHRLGMPIRAITVLPLQGTLDAIEMAAQTDLVRVLTHELLNSLTPVTSLARTAADALAASPVDHQTAQTAMATVSRRITSLHRFIQSYRSVASAPIVRLQAFAADVFADELIRMVGLEWPGTSFHAEVDASLMLHADPDLLAQALINLLRNAAQAAAGADQPHVTLRITAERAGGLSLSIADNGPGVPESLRRDIFLPFYTTRAEGTGIGLNLVRQIVVAHGWSIDVEHSDDGGARFVLRTAGAAS